MTQQLLDDPDICAFHQKVCREAVAKDMWRYFFNHTCPLNPLLDRFLNEWCQILNSELKKF